jgi:hypothetical protein
MRKSATLCFLWVFISTPLVAEPAGRDIESICGLTIYRTVQRLASEEFQGRLSGHAGYDAAAAWIADRFQSWGLKPADEKHGYLLPFPIQYTIVHDAAMSLFVPDEGPASGFREIVLEPEIGFLPLLFSDTADRTAGVVFVGWGIHAPELGYDDYFGVEVHGKFVMCFRGTPDPRNRAYQHHDQHRTRMQQAKNAGALGLIYIYEEPIANPNGDWIEGFTPVNIGYAAADHLLVERDVCSAALRADLLKYRRPISFELRSTVRIRVESTHFPQATGYNVVGYVEGADPQLRHEVVVVGAHLDHCGTHMGLLFGGADDNASGSAVVMEIARALGEGAIRTERSVLFALFGAEEMGLIGSRHLANHFPDRFTKIANMINFDMVGAGDGSRCGYSADHADLKQRVQDADRHVRTVRSMFPIRELGVRGSDHAPFHAQGIPVLYFVSNGPHLHYHRTGDTIYRMNPHIMQDIARIGYLLAIDLATR